MRDGDAVGEDEGEDGDDEAVEEEVGEEADGDGGEDEEGVGAPAQTAGWVAVGCVCCRQHGEGWAESWWVER